MNTNTNLSFLQAHSFPFFNRHGSSKVTESESFDNPSACNQISRSSENQQQKKQKPKRQQQIKNAKQCCKRFFTFLFSHIGLSAILVAYVIFGGVIFLNLEKLNEIDVKKEVLEHRKKFIKEIIQLFENNQNLLVKSKNQIKKSSLKKSLNDFMINYTKDIIKYIQEKGWNGDDDIEILNWSFEGSLLYVITVITTIGYGHVAPKTSFGKFLTMMYALLGIPLTFLYLSNVGDYLADWFRFIYHKICRKLCNYCCQRIFKKQNTFRNRLQKVNAFPGLQNKSKFAQKQPMTSNNILNQPLKQFRSKWKRLLQKSEGNQNKLELPSPDSFSYDNPKIEHFTCKSYGVARFLPSMQTIKQRDNILMNCVSTNVPVINWKDIDTDLELGSIDNIHTISNIEITPEMFYTINEPMTNAYSSTINETVPPRNSEIVNLNMSYGLSKIRYNPTCQSLPHLPNILDISVKDESVKSRRRSSFAPDINFMSENIKQVSYISINNIVDRDNESNKRNKNVNIQIATVPISLSLAVIWIYILFGSIIFTIWDEPDYLKWSYFCFITLSTIGFGDIVPGTKIDSKNPKEKLILVSIYVIIGLSVFAMCFKLMQEEVVAKFKRFVKKLEALKLRLLRLTKSQKKNSEMVVSLSIIQ